MGWFDELDDTASRLLHASEVRERSLRGGDGALEIIEEAERSIFALSERGRVGGFQPIKRVAAEGLEKLEELSERREMVTGLPTGYAKLDRILAQQTVEGTS